MYVCYVVILAKQYGHILHAPGNQQYLSWPALLNSHVCLLQTCIRKPGVFPLQALQLCWAVYQFHFQFLVFLGSYVKLLNVFYAAKQAERVSCTKASQCMVESTDMKLAWCSHIMYGTYIMCIFRFLPCIDIIDECMSMAKERCYIF